MLGGAVKTGPVIGTPGGLSFSGSSSLHLSHRSKIVSPPGLNQINNTSRYLDISGVYERISESSQSVSRNSIVMMDSTPNTGQHC